MKDESNSKVSKMNQCIQSKKKYHPPILQMFGKLNRLTQGSLGGNNDAGGSNNGGTMA